MLLSIIVPVFNGEKKIGRCLESLLILEEDFMEFIIVNDGSTDDTRNICEKYVQKDHRFRLINQKNAGVSKARNTGISLAQGKYIGFVDADDELTSDYNEIVKIIKKTESDFFAFEHYVQTETNLEKRVRNIFSYGENEVNTLYENFLSGTLSCVWNNVYKASIINNYNIQFPDDMDMGEDTEFNARYIKYCQNAFYIEKAGYKYYFGNIGNATNARKISYLKDFVRIYDNFVTIRNSYGKSGFPFYCPYYIEKVYEILKANWRSIEKEEKIAFRKSNFYYELMQYRYKNWKDYIRKLLIRLYIL